MNSSFDKRITKLTVWIFWRWLLISLLAPILGACSGFILGFVLGMSGVHIDNIKLISGLVGGAIGLCVTFFGLRFLLRKAIENRVLGLELEMNKQPPSGLERY